jgi:type 1 glutamine amidotransferase
LRPWRFFFAPLPRTPKGGDGTTRIILIGGKKSHGPGEHDFPNGIRRLESLLESSPDGRAFENVMVVEAYPDAWPSDLAVLENAATIVWYFDGLENHPLLDAKRRAQFERLMSEGVGLVTLHQASTVPPDDTAIDLPRWLGGARYGMVDRTTERVTLEPAAHAISRGVSAFTYHDEFYPTIRFVSAPRQVAPVLSGTLHAESADGKSRETEGAVRPVAWAFERAGGGRSFGFTGLHYLAGLDQPALRKLLLNAIVWSASLDVPREGMRSATPNVDRQRSTVVNTVIDVTRSATQPAVSVPASGAGAP